MRVFLAGASGAVGRPLVRQLVAAGHHVTGTARRDESAARVREEGADAVVCDAFDVDGLVRAVTAAKPDAVIHQMTAIPKEIDPRRIAAQFEETNRLRTEGTRNLIAAAREASASKLLAQSIAFAYRPSDPSSLRHEDDPLWDDAPRAFRPLLEAVIDLERQVREHEGGIVLRYGYFYGPGTAYAKDGSTAERVRKRELPLVGDGGAVFSFVHVEDAASATLAALERGTSGVYNIVDDEPAPASEWLPFYAGVLGAPKPMRVPKLVARAVAGSYAVYLMTEQSGASNAKARRELRFAPRYPSWRTGFREALG